MASNATLTATTLDPAVAGPTSDDTVVYLASTDGLEAGFGLFVDRELMTVTTVGVRVDGGVDVRRGQGGSVSARHAAGATVLFGRLDQFYQCDPLGVPPDQAVINPWVNTVTGTVWMAQGDDVGPQVDARWWQPVSTTYGIGALGIRTTTSSPDVTDAN